MTSLFNKVKNNYKYLGNRVLKLMWLCSKPYKPNQHYSFKKIYNQVTNQTIFQNRYYLLYSKIAKDHKKKREVSLWEGQLKCDKTPKKRHQTHRYKC